MLILVIIHIIKFIFEIEAKCTLRSFYWEFVISYESFITWFQWNRYTYVLHFIISRGVLAKTWKFLFKTLPTGISLLMLCANQQNNRKYWNTAKFWPGMFSFDFFSNHNILWNILCNLPKCSPKYFENFKKSQNALIAELIIIYMAS